MKNLVFAAVVAAGMVAVAETAPGDAVTQADLKALYDRITKLESENKAQAKKIADLEAAKPTAAKPEVDELERAYEEGTEVSKSGRVVTTEQGFKYYLADKAAGIFEPLSESGLKITPYGYLVFEGIHNTHKTAVDAFTDWVLPRKNGGHNGDHQTCFTMQDSILGLQFVTPEAMNGWTFDGKAEFDFAGDHANDSAFHWRHLYFQAHHDGFDSDGKKNGEWSILFGQTWHLFKMVSPSEFDGAWMENTGHPYRRSPQIRVTRRWDWDADSFEARVGLVKNGPGMGGDRDYDDNQDTSASAWALIEAAFIYERDAAWQRDWVAEDSDLADKRWLVGVAGMYGRDKSHRISDFDANGDAVYGGQGDEYDTELVMAALQIPVWHFTLAGQFFAGENLGGVQGGIGQRVGYYGVGQKGKGVRTVGGFADLSYRFNKKLDFALGYGFDDPNDSDAACANGRTFNERMYVDVFYHITSNFRLGFEYAHLTTKYYNDGDAKDDRIEVAAFYDF